MKIEEIIAYKNGNTLELHKKKINYQEVILIGDILAEDASIDNLDLGSNGIGDDGAIVIAEALKAKSNLPSEAGKVGSLIMLQLSSNKIKDKGAIAIASALEVNTSLDTFELNNNQIENNGAIALANALKLNKSLKSIDLASNRIKDDGAKAIADALEVNSTLTKLYLNSNQITEQYIKKISDLIDENKNVSLISDKIFSNFRASQNLTFDDKELKLINTSPRACEKILTQLLDKFKTKETEDGIEFKGNDFVENMKGFKVGLTILLNCKDSEVFESLNNPLTVNDFFKGLGVMKDNASKNNVFAEPNLLLFGLNKILKINV